MERESLPLRLRGRTRRIALVLAVAAVLLIAAIAGANYAAPLLTVPIVFVFLLALSYGARTRFALDVAKVLAVAWSAMLGDIMFFGPYSRLYCRELEQRASAGNLLGRDESAVNSILGPPSFVYESTTPTDLDGNPRPGARTYTCYNYAPFHSRLSTRFQVFCENGVVVGIDPTDD